MNYNKLNTLLQGRCLHRRKLANNTYAIRQDTSVIAIRLHNTYILTFFSDGTITYNTGGWRTPTTKQRLNEYGPLKIYQHKRVWYYDDNKPFHEGQQWTPFQTNNPV